MSSLRRHQHGINLIELIVTMSIAAITLTMGVPSFQGLRVSSDRSSAIIELVAAARLARSEAALRGTPASVCASDDGSSCSASTDWSNGWLVFRDQDGDAALDEADIVVKTVQFSNPRFTITADNAIGSGITFEQFGYPRPSQAGGDFDYEDPRASRCINLTYVGRLNVVEAGCAE
ncbi:MAG: GspH/FimT family pseudopilin [Thiohalocapsa sp.]